MEQKTVGPKTSRREFFSEHIKLDLPEFAGLKEALDAGDIAKCEKIFADAMKNSPITKMFIEQRKNEKKNMSEDRKKFITEHGLEAMDYTVCSCGIKHTFEKGKIDWTANPTPTGYAEWTWQLSRHPELSYLSQYYYLTEDEEVAKVFADYLQSWIEQAIVPDVGIYGTNSLCWRTIEAGIRMMSWALYFCPMMISPSISDKLICDFYVSMYEHGLRLRNDYTTFNWRIMEMHGLIKVALNAPFLKAADEWFDFAINLLCDEIDNQIYADGFQCELTTNYHYVVEANYRNVFGSLKQYGREIPAEMKKKVSRCFKLYPNLCRPNRTTPNLNDGAELNVTSVMKDVLKHYPERDDYRWFATDGKEGTPPDFLSVGMEYSGVIVMRNSWERDGIWAYMDGSPFGIEHHHEDKLNVLLDAYGKVMLTETGCFAYDSSEMRKATLASRGHNTVMLNGKEQNRDKLYRRADMVITKKADMTFNTTAEYDVAYSWYDEGYGDDLEDMKHSRRLIFVKNAQKYGLKPFFVVVDRFEAQDEGARKYEQMWHTEALECAIDKSAAQCDFGEGVGLMLATSDKDAAFVNMRGQYEPYYQGFMPIGTSGQKEHRPIHTPVLVGEFEGKRRVVTVLYPFNDGENNFVSVDAGSDFDAYDLTLNTKNGKFTLDEREFV